MQFVLIALILIVVIILVRCIRIVQQARAYVSEFLGAYKSTWNVGSHFKLPFVERVAKVVSLKEQVADFPRGKDGNKKFIIRRFKRPCGKLGNNI